jgi:hypothetical protein
MDTIEWRSGLEYVPFQRLNALSGLYALRPLVMTSINQDLQLNPNTSKLNILVFDTFRHRAD